jgi:hypothetical protein
MVFSVERLVAPEVDTLLDCSPAPSNMAVLCAMKAMEETVRAQHRLLRHIFGVRGLRKSQRARLKAASKCGRDEHLEAHPILRVQHVGTFPLGRTAQ